MTHNIDIERLRRLVVTRRTYGAALRDMGARRRNLIDELRRRETYLEEVQGNRRSSESQLQEATNAVAETRHILAGVERDEEEASDRFSLVARLADRGRKFAIEAGVCPPDLAEI